MAHSVLSTVVVHCGPLIRGENGDSFPLPYMYTAPPCVYKRGRRALSSPFSLSSPCYHMTNSLASPARSPDIGTCLNHLAETWELPSLSRLACTPYYRHLRCKIIQCTHTPLCWTYGPVARTRINPCVPDRRVRTPTLVYLFILKKAKIYLIILFLS